MAVGKLFVNLNLIYTSVVVTIEQTLLENIKTKFNKQKGLDPFDITPTIGLNVCKTNYKNLDITIWDLGGKRELRSLWKDYFSSCHIILFMYDSSIIYSKQNEQEFLECQEMLRELDADEDLQQVPFILLENEKQSANIPMEPQNEPLHNLCIEHSPSCKVFRVNSWNGNGIEHVFQHIATDLKQNIREVNNEDFV